MPRLRANQVLAVIRLSSVAPRGTSGYINALLDPNCDPMVLADALAQLRKYGGLVARYADDYERGANVQRAVKP